MVKKKSLGSKLYSGAAGFGKIEAVISAIIFTLISIVLLVIGYNIISHRNHLKSITGNVKISNCTGMITYDDGNYNAISTCDTDVVYKINDKSYTFTVNTGSKKFKPGDEIELYDDPRTPGKVEYNPVSKTMGWVLISISIFLLLVSWSWVYLTQKSKMAAAVGGTAAGISMIKSVF